VPVALILIAVAAFFFDRWLKLMATAAPTSVARIIDGVILFEPLINNRGPLGIVLPSYLFFILAVTIISALLGLAWYERSTINRGLLALLALGVISNGYDRLKFNYIIDVFSLLGRMSFNLADLLILTGLAGIIVRHWSARRRSAHIAP